MIHTANIKIKETIEQIKFSFLSEKNLFTDFISYNRRRRTPSKPPKD